MDRVPTGIAGLDSLIEGGFPKGYNILVTGAPGTGKSIMGLQYIYNGALNGENGLYITIDSPRMQLIEQAGRFGWDFKKMEEEGKITFLSIPPNRARIDIFDMLEDKVAEANAKRLVFDNLALLTINAEQFAIPMAHNSKMDVIPNITSKSSMLNTDTKDYEIALNAEFDNKGRAFYHGDSKRRITYFVIHELGCLGTTNLIITFADPTTQSSMDKVSEFACDGVIKLEKESIGEVVNRTLEVAKMRTTKIDSTKHNFDFDSRGIAIE